MQESWETVAAGLRDHDSDAVERGIKRMQDAGAAAQRAISP